MIWVIIAGSLIMTIIADQLMRLEDRITDEQKI